MRRWSCLAALPYLLSPAYGAGLGPSSGEPAAPAASERASSYIHWLEERSMLQQARVLARHYSGNSIQWQHPYGQPQPHAAVARASVWFTAYPASTIAASPGTSVILTPAAVDALQKKGYIVGQLHSGIFYEPGVKDTDWSATDVVRGADGVERRWVYLHYFKQGQPTLNWLDPSFAAERLVIGDA